MTGRPGNLNEATIRLNASINAALDSEGFERFLTELMQQIDEGFVEIEASSTMQFLDNLLERFGSRENIGRMAFRDGRKSDIRDVALALASAVHE